MSMTMKHDPMMLGLVLVVGAVMYSRSAKAQQFRTAPPGTGSMPGSIGSGANQVIGGIVGSLAALFRTAPTQRWTSYDPMHPSEGISYDPADPGQVIPLQDLVNGSAHDYMTGDTSSAGIPTTTDIFTDVTGSGAGSFMGPGAYWQN